MIIFYLGFLKVRKDEREITEWIKREGERRQIEYCVLVKT